jgi:hypothetical protein
MPNKSQHFYVRATAVAAVALFIFTTPALGVDLGKMVGGGSGGKLASLIGDKLGVKLGESAVSKLLEQGQQVSGSVIDPGKLAGFGLEGLAKGGKVDLINLGKNLLKVTNPLDGKFVKLNTKEVFGVLAGLFK